MSVDEFLQWLRLGRLGPCAPGASRSDIIEWLGEPETFGYNRRSKGPNRDLLTFRDLSFQVGLRANRVVSYGLYFRYPSGAKFFSELGIEDGLHLAHSTTKQEIVSLLREANIELYDRGDRIDLDSGVSICFDDGALDSIQVCSPRGERR